MKQYKLTDSEYKFVDIIWNNEPVGSSVVVKKCNEVFGWKKSTTYTVLKRLEEKGVLKNENSIVTTLISKSEVQKYQSDKIIKEMFEGSLPSFIAAFMQDKKLTKEEAENLKKLIDEYEE